MAIPVQKTKLFIPPARPRLVDRPRLLEKMNHLRGEACRAALVSAPAGSGKTTLITQWLASQAIPTGWLSLDERDNLPARFFSYLIAALQAVASTFDMPEMGREALSLLELPGSDPEEIITLLTNDLVDVPGPFILVLDDFHTITNPLLHQAIDVLIEAQPPQMRLVLLSREDPGLQLARRRARGQLVEIRQLDLSFTLDEASAFLNQSMDLHLTSEQVQALAARTEGWIAGLQMASLALQAPLALSASAGFNHPDHIERFLQNFSGSHRFILDYLMEEVLARQPQAVQTFLLETSILERMQADLCAAITGHTIEEAQRLLEQISKANLFVIPLDEERRWFRYHHLFGDLLLARLKSESSTQAGERERQALLQRASDWFEANGEPRLAVEYALKAQNPQRAADLLERHITERWQTVDIEFHLLMNRLPFEVIADRPLLCLQSAWLCVLLGQTERILPFVEAAERAIDRLGDQTNAAANRAFARTLRAYLEDLHNQPVSLGESLDLAYAAIPETNPGMRNSVAVVIGTIYFMEGAFDAALRLFEDALALDKRVNGTNAVPIATMRICYVLHAQGRLHEAMRRVSESEAYVRERGIRRFYISGALNLRMAEIRYEWNQLDEAEAQIHAGLRLLEDWPLPTTRCLGLNLLARVCMARGDLAGARAALAQANAIQQQADLHPTFLNAIEQARLRLILTEKNRVALEAWAKEKDTLRQKPLCFRYEAMFIELCRAWLALGREAEAADLLERLAKAALGRDGSRVSILALQAAALHQQPSQALPVLEEALCLAEPEGYLRTFLEAGEALPQVLRLWLQQGVSKSNPRVRAYAQSILSAFEQPGAEIALPQSQDLAEPLSQREQEVLRLIAQGLSNQQIADRLVISIRTVKKHVENIHGKLGVMNRTQAVARARELRLID